MFKKKQILLLVGLVLLSGCSAFNVEVARYDFSRKNNEISPLSGEHLQQIGEFNRSFRDVFEQGEKENVRKVYLPAKGQQNILVLPVEFPSYPKEELDKNEGKTAHAIIENAFFGQESTNQWESVASYYYKSSYGQLKLDGMVAPWYQIKNQTTLNNLSDCSLSECTTNRRNVSSAVVSEAVDAYRSSVDQAWFNTTFDQNSDGYVDAVFVIYTHPIGNEHSGKAVEGEGRDSLFWAYATHDVTVPNLIEPTAKLYGWASYDFLYPSYSLTNTKPDARTLIHEVGHFFGLEDYYNTRSSEESILPRPTGGLDMMDYSLGDHTAFSKLLLEWVDPYVVSGPSKVTLRPFVETGDVILIPSNPAQEDVFDEYLLLEFYTPTGLNYYDTHAEQNITLFNEYGLKVYHVNAKLRLPISGQYDYFYNNSPSNSNETVLYRLLESDGGHRLMDGNIANNETLFQTGDSFALNEESPFIFNSGASLPYGFKVTQQTTNGMTVEFI